MSLWLSQTDESIMHQDFEKASGFNQYLTKLVTICVSCSDDGNSVLLDLGTIVYDECHQSEHTQITTLMPNQWVCNLQKEFLKYLLQITLEMF